MRLKSRRRRSSFESTIPLINVVFLLLIFLMIAGTPAQKDPFKIDPVYSITDEEPDQTQRVIYFSKTGEIAYGNARNRSDVIAAIAAEHASEQPMNLIVKADRDLDTAILIDLAKELKAIGIQSLVLLTQGTT